MARVAVTVGSFDCDSVGGCLTVNLTRPNFRVHRSAKRAIQFDVNLERHPRARSRNRYYAATSKQRSRLTFT